jgi:hypothetical protein
LVSCNLDLEQANPQAFGVARIRKSSKLLAFPRRLIK